MELQQEQAAQQQQQSSVIEWAVARQHNTPEGKGSRALLSVVKATPNGVLVAIIDGVGHGAESAALAQTADNIMEDYTHQTLTELFARCDKALRNTNGVAISGAIINTGMNMITWFGVGNVQGFLYHRNPAADPRCHVLERFTGLVGGNSQFRLREMCLPIKPGDLLIFANDGMGSNFTESLPIDGKPRGVADQLLAKYAASDGDSVLIVVRYLGH